MFEDYRDLLNEVRPDIVTIATRTEGRCDIIAAAAAAGVAAMHAEKPLCRSLAEAAGAATEMGRRGTASPGAQLDRHMEAYREAKRMVSSGELGALRQVVVKLGVGALQWTHPHALDIASYFADDADIITARAVFAEPFARTGDVLDADPQLEMGHIQFATGASAIITVAEGCDVIAACERGEVTVLDDGAQVEVRRQQGIYLLDRTVTRPKPAASGLQILFALSSLRDAVRPTGGRAASTLIWRCRCNGPSSPSPYRDAKANAWSTPGTCRSISPLPADRASATPDALDVAS